MARSLLLPGDRPLLNLALLAATLATTFLVWWSGLHGGSPRVAEALAFSLSTVAILGAHEMGHYLFARLHGLQTSLPYFIPLPLGFGTLGAVIRIRSRIPHRNALVDIGASGPIAGLIVAIPVLVVGLTLSTVGPVPDIPSNFPHDWSAISLAQKLPAFVSSLFSGEPDESMFTGATVYGDNLLMQGLQRLVFGAIPEGHDVFVHPMVVAGWFGLLVTLLNLCPIGQLDGGHVAYAIFGERARYVGMVTAAGLLFLALFFSASWLVWLVVTTKFIGFEHPYLVDEEAKLSTSRQVVALVCLVALVLCVVPVPIQIVTLPLGTP